MHTDETNRLYSTFAGVARACIFPDTILNFSQSELLKAVKQFANDNCNLLSMSEREELALFSVKAQEIYEVHLCHDGHGNHIFRDIISRSGTWVLADVLGRRNVVIEW